MADERSLWGLPVVSVEKAVTVDEGVSVIFDLPPRADTPCRVYWGSHGCDLERGHDGSHVCSCCDCPDGAHDGMTAPRLSDEINVVCVGRAPYYGPETRFYGEDADG